MNIDRNDSWNDDDFLSGALRGAADNIPGGEVDDLHISFGVVRDRVRRRRAAKIGSLAGVSLVLVGGIAFGATKTPLLDSDAPVLPGESQSAFMTPGPDDSASDTATQAPEPVPSGPPARDIIQFDYTPPWLTEIDSGRLTCGMPVDELESTAAGWSVTAAGDIYSKVENYSGVSSPALGMAATFQGGDGSLDVAPTLVWSQDGVVVDLGLNVFEGAGPQTEPLLGSGGGAVEAQGRSASSCIPTGTSDVFETSLPDGDYEVRVVAFPEVVSGQWGTAVSEPVEVRFDGTGVHSPTGTRGGTATIEPLAPNEDELTRFVLDRSTDWVLAQQEQSNYSSTDPTRVTAQCESVSTGDSVPFEIVVPSTQDVVGSGSIDCDATEQVTDVEVPDVGGEVLDIRLGDVPDGVVRLEAVLAPSGGDGGDAAADCSASGLTMEYDPSRSPSEGASTTARAIVTAAQDCDVDRMVELATQHPTELMVTAEPAEEVFALPEGDEQHYRTLVALLAGTGGAFDGADTANRNVVWPRVATEEFRDSDEAWREVVTAGLLTEEQADAQRADELFGYTGMEVAIDEAGAWRIYAATP
ncbi:hypothetical protein APR04_003957 [Promicromonospora umidemergens]|uniref:Uncharacterized protein n=1 Tax=Promicromonospora umidemergens TaxID=629679 RepID=A0ABP8X2E3_9MICO|nr:hypothetical protein [Promicromonospora umidemergens]MCP2285030.1 hypothetical protein [Promicromonospora umidemergens]